ncbi:MAG: metallophosphoesterase [Culicoidibacterales bacterium]
MKRLFLVILATILFVVALFSYGFLIGTKSFQVNEIKLASPKIPTSFHFTKLAVFSDILLNNNYTFEQFEGAMEQLIEQEPTMIFFLGDVIDMTKFSELDQQRFIQTLSELTAPAGKFFVLGDQDLANKDTVISLFEQAGFIYLAPNQIHQLYFQNLEHIQVAAFDPQTDPATMQATLAQLDPEGFNFVVNHFPDSFAMTQTTPAVYAQFSGHSLAGQINIPGLRNLLAAAQGQKYPVSQLGTPSLFVSQGLGNQADLPIRIFNAPSITIYNLQKTTS